MGREVVSRAEAISRGLKRYFTGTACSRGHVAEKHVSSRQCCECEVAGKRRRRASFTTEQAADRRADDLARYYANRETIRERRRRANLGAEKVASLREATARWLREHPEVRTANRHRRRARKLRAGGVYTPADIAKLLEIQRGKCASCSGKLDRYHVDHIVPLSRGGSNCPENLQVLCPTCNQRKHAKDPIAWAHENGRLF